MKNILLLIPFLVFEVQYSKAQDSLEWTREEYKILQEKQSKAESDIRHLKRVINEASVQLHTLSKDNQVLSISVDSLRSDFEKLSKVQEADRNLASRKIGEAQEEFTRFGAVQIRRQKVPNPPRGVEDKWGREPNKITAHRPRAQNPGRWAFYIPIKGGRSYEP